MSILEFNNICKSFSGVEVLHNISFNLDKGNVVAFMAKWCWQINADESVV